MMTYEYETEARVPPHNLEAEIAVLGAALLDDSIFDSLSVSQLRPEHFYREGHRLMWDCMPTLRERLTEDFKPGPVDLLTLSEELNRRGQLDRAGGLTYLAGLSDQVPTSAYAPHYARLVLEKAHLRAHISHAGRVMRHAYQQDIQLEDIDALASTPPQLPTAEQPVTRLGSALKDVLQQAREGTGHAGIPTELIDLDELIGGLEPGRLYVVAARPSMGKTAMAFQLASTTAKNHGRALCFSLEMPADEISARLVCSEARVDILRFGDARRGNPLRLGERDWQRLNNAQDKLDELPLDILTKRGLTLSTMVDQVRREHAREPLALFLLDYIQLVTVSGQAGDNPVQSVTMVSVALKSLAMELGIPVMALSQLSRAVEQRPNHRPMLSDLRGSGSVEQDADVVMFIYRDEYYNKETDQQGIAEIIVAKQRNGPVGTVKVSFHAAFTRFASLASGNI